MEVKCKKCGFKNATNKFSPHDPCPNCGAIYAKVESALRKQSAAPTDNGGAPPKKRAKKPGLHSVKDVGEKNKAGAVENPPVDSKVGTCKACGGVVSKSAKLCPHCGEKKPIENKGLGFMGWVGVAVLAIWIISILGDRSGSGDASKTKMPDSFDAMLNCERFVKNRLKSPSTADFAPRRDLIISGSGKGPWTVLGYVDAQNGFGAMIREKYFCKIEFVGNNQVRVDEIRIY